MVLERISLNSPLVGRDVLGGVDVLPLVAVGVVVPLLLVVVAAAGVEGAVAWNAGGAPEDVDVVDLGLGGTGGAVREEEEDAAACGVVVGVDAEDDTGAVPAVDEEGRD